MARLDVRDLYGNMKLKLFEHVPRDKYKFNLEEGERCVWRRIIGSIPTAWVAKLADPSREVKSGDWLSIY